MANPWYKTGTVAVTNNSKTVIVTGALLVVNTVAAGDIFFAPDGLAYEIESVESDNQFTLVNVYAGSTQSGQPYGIVRFMSQSPISLANLIVDKTVSWENVIDQMSLYISGTASTSSVAPEDLCINYSIGTVQTGIAEVDCPTGFTFVASGSNIASGWYLFEDTVGNYRVAMHPETLKAEVSAIKDLAVTAQVGAETAQTAAEGALATTLSTINLEWIAPNSGYTQVAKKLDNFVFQEVAGFTYKVGDKNRFIKFGSKVIDTHAHASYDATTQSVIADFSAGMPDVTEIITNGSNVTSVALTAGDYVVDGSQLITNGTFDTDVTGWTPVGSTIAHTVGNTMEVTLTAEGRATQNINTVVGETYLVKGNLINDVAGQSYIAARNDSAVSLGNGAFGNTDQMFTFTATTTTSIISAEVYGGGGSTCEFDNITVYRVSNVFRCITDAPIGTALTNATYFEDRTTLGVTNQVLAYHAYNTSTNVYEGILTEVIFNDVAKDDLKNLDTVMIKAGFTKVSDYLYSKGDYHAVPMGIWQSLNSGVYHPFLNQQGVFAANDNLAWYGTATTLASTADCFTPAKIGTTNTQPESKIDDYIYASQFVDLRPFAKVLTGTEVKLTADDRIDNGTSETVFTEEFTQTTTGAVSTLEVLDGTRYKQGDSLQVWDGTTAYRRSVVSVSVNELTIDTAITKTAVPFIICGGHLPVLSSGTSLSTELVGSPSNYPTLLTDRLVIGIGVVGLKPLLVSDIGDALIPDGIIDDFKVSEKATEFFNIVKSTDSGATWTASAPTNSLITNAITMTNEPAANITLTAYTSKNKPLIPNALQSVIDVINKVYASNHYGIYQFALIGNQISGKIQVGNGAFQSRVLENSEVGENGDIQTVPSHSVLALDASTSPASKYFNVIEEDVNGNAYLGVYGEEITYDGIGEWGDTDFNQLTNGTIPDVNGGADVRTFHGIMPVYGKVR